MRFAISFQINFFICLYHRSVIIVSELHANRLAVLLIIQVPRVSDHQLEVLIVVNRRRDVAIVVDEFVERDLAVAQLRDAIIGGRGAVRLERLNEVLEDLLSLSLASFHVGVLTRIIQLLDVVGLDDAIFVEVDLVEDTLDEVLAVRRHFTLDGRQQLVEVNFAGLVAVEQVEEVAAFDLAELEAEVAQTLPEFLDADDTITSVVQDLEDTLEANEAASASSSKAVSELLHELIVLVLDARVASTSVAARAELVSVGVLVVEGSRASSRVARLHVTASHGSVRCTLPVSSGALRERSRRIRAKQVSVMILQVLLSGADLGNLLRGTSVRHGSRVGRAVKAPRVRDHEIKVRVAVNVDADVVVVFSELIERDHAVVSSALVEDSVVLLEGIHEIVENFLFRLLTTAHIRMHGTRVVSRELLHVDDTVTARIKLGEGTLHKALTELVHVADDDADELVEADLASAVIVDRLEQVLHVLHVDIHVEVVDHLFKFGHVEGSRAVVVGNLELSLETNDAVATTLLEGLSEALDKHTLELGRSGSALHLESSLVRLGLLALTALCLTSLGRERDAASAQLTIRGLLTELHGTSLVTESGALLVAVVLLGLVERVSATLHAGAVNILLLVALAELDGFGGTSGLGLVATITLRRLLSRVSEAPNVVHDADVHIIIVAHAGHVVVEVEPLLDINTLVVGVAQSVVSVERFDELVAH